MLATELISSGVAQLAQSLTRPDAWVAVGAGLLGGALTVSSAFVKTILPLRWLAVGSNVGFIIYGALNPTMFVFVLHSVLLPVNLARACQMHRLTRRVRNLAESSDTSGIWLRPHMKRARCKAGAVLFRAGDRADRLYFLLEGRVEIVESAIELRPGQIFGEIAFFAPDRKRTGSARCATDCTILSIDEATFEQLYYQNPEFGFQVVRLIAGRLSHSMHVVQARLADAQDRISSQAPAPLAERVCDEAIAGAPTGHQSKLVAGVAGAPVLP